MIGLVWGITDLAPLARDDPVVRILYGFIRMFGLVWGITDLAPLAGDDPVVDPAGLVPAHLARDDLDLGWKEERKNI